MYCVPTPPVFCCDSFLVGHSLSFASSHYTALLNITLHYTTLIYTSQHFFTLLNTTQHYSTLLNTTQHFSTLLYTTVHKHRRYFSSLQNTTPNYFQQVLPFSHISFQLVPVSQVNPSLFQWNGTEFTL